MGLRRFVQRLLHGDRRHVPRTPDAAEAVRRKQTVERRLRHLEVELQLHADKPRHR